MSFARAIAVFALPSCLLPALLPAAPDFSVNVPDFSLVVEQGKRLTRLHSILVSRHGQLVLEQYFHGTRANSYENTKSASKSVISALIGIAIDRKLIGGLDTPIAQYFPQLNAASIDPRKKQITIEDLLSMRSALVETNRGYGPWVRSPNWVNYLLTKPMQGSPREIMNYNTGNTHLLSAILTKVSGTSTLDFARKTLAQPLGVTLPAWPTDPQGIYFGGNDMLLTPRAMLKFGELYLNKGKIGEQQVVPEKWVEDSWQPRAASPISGHSYGLGWWSRDFAGHSTHFAWGFGGQYIFVVPDLDLVVVTTSSVALGDDRREYRSELFHIVENQVIAPMAAH